MKKKFFMKNLLFFIVPVLVPVLILGIFVSYIMDNHLAAEKNARNTYELITYANSIDSIMGELERLHTSLSTNPAMVLSLKKMLSVSGRGLSAEDYRTLNVIIDLLCASSNSNPYIESLYVYFNVGSDYFISSTNRLSDFNYFYDTEWYNSYQGHFSEPANVWTEYRMINRYREDKFPTWVLTIYRKIFSSGKSEPDGILVLNVKANEVNKLLNTMSEIPEKNIFVIDSREAMVIFNNDRFGEDLLKSRSFNCRDILDKEETVFNYKTDTGYYTINKIASSVYNWVYVSAIPYGILHRVSLWLKQLTYILIAAAIAISLSIAYYFANKNYADIKNILNFIEKASRGERLDRLPAATNDVFSYILHNIVKTFLENDYLQVQLSERKYHMRTLELLALQSQLNPHFLFNTMETIYWKVMALTGKPNEATHMIENISDILRYSLDSDGDMANLPDEISITKSYLEIQRVRYRNQFKAIWDYPAEVKDVRIVKLILQPLVENSIYHGIKQKGGHSLIRVRIRIKGEMLKIIVTDSGIGMDRDTLRIVKEMLKSGYQESSEHIGLYNTNKRIKLTYGDKYGIHIRSKRNFGTSIIISVPVVYSSSHNDQAVP